MKTRLIAVFTLLSGYACAQNVGIGSTTFTPNDDALLELRSTTSGFLVPKMTEAQMNAISGPTEGLLVYQTNNTKGFMYYDGSAWVGFGGAGAGDSDDMGDHIATQNIQLSDNWISNDGGNEGIRVDNSGNVGIGTAVPTQKLQIQVANNGLNMPLFLRNSNNSQGGGNGIGIGFNSEQNGDWMKAGIFHERTANYGVGKLHFLVDNVSDNQSVSLAESRMTIDKDGKVGIGTTSPTKALDVKSNAAGVNVITVQNTTASGWSSIDFNDQSGSLSTTFGFANSGTSGIFTNRAYMNSYDHDFVLTRNSSENSIFIKGSNGQIGINTNNPQARLHVQGDARITDLAGSGTRMVVADANGDLSTQALPTSGSAPTTVESTSSQNINASSYTSVSGMSISSVSAGTYLVNFNADINRNGSSSCNCIVRAGGSDDSDTERTFQLSSSGASQYHLMGKVTLSSTGTIEVRCKKIPGGSGITVGNRAMSIQATN